MTANPTIFARAIEGSDAYDDRFAALTAKGRSVPDTYWELVVDVIDALAVLRPTFDATGGIDGFVSIEVAPELARNTDATIAVMDRLAAVSVDMDEVGGTLEDQGVAGFHESFEHVLGALHTKARQLAGG